MKRFGITFFLFGLAFAASVVTAFAQSMPPREIKLTGNYLLVPVRAVRDPGAKEPNKGNVVTVRVAGEVVHNFGVILATKPEQVEYWASLDMSEYVGKTASLSVRGAVLENALALFESSDAERYLKPLYSESGRAQVSLQPEAGLEQ